MYMLNQRVISATQARIKFFDLLKMAEEDKEVIIIKRDNNRRFKLIAVKESKKNVEKLLKEMGNIGIESMSPKQMKKIFETRYDG